MRVVSVHAPRRKHSFCKAVLAGAPDMIHDLVMPVLDDGFPYTPRQIIQSLVPPNSNPFPLATFSGAFQRIKNSVRIGDLIDRRRAFSAIAASRTRMLGIPFELSDLQALSVDVCKQSTRRFTVKAGRGHKHVTMFDSQRVQFDPIVPTLFRRKGGQMNTARARIKRLSTRLDLFSRRTHTLVQFV